MPDDAQGLLEMAFSGKTASEILVYERKFPICLRYGQEYLKDKDHISALMVSTQEGVKIPLKEINTMEKDNGGFI